MKRIVLDFLARWWWMIVFFVLFTGFFASVGVPLLLAPAALICLLFDAQRGALRAVRPLPVARHMQALAWWFIGVAMLPLISLAPLCIGTIIFSEMHAVSATVAPWFQTGVQFWVGMGFGGFGFLVLTAMLTHPPSGIRDWFFQIILSILWGFSMPAIPFILPHLPKTPDAILPWHWALIVASPVCVVFSYFAAPAMMQRRMFPIAAKTKTDSSPEQSEKLSTGLQGVPLYLVTFIGRLIALLLFLSIFQILFLHLVFGGKGDVASQKNPVTWSQVAVFSIIFGAITIESIGLRALRCLPLSTARLAALMLTIPCATGLFGALLIVFWGHIGNPALPVGINFAAQALALAGFGSLTVAITLHISSGARLFIYMLFAMVSAFGLQLFAVQTAMFAITGACALAGSFALLHRGLRKSNAFYQPRRLFGMAVGQPMAMR